MKTTTQFEKHLSNVIGHNVTYNKEIIGKVIDYEPETGSTTIEINDDTFAEIIGNQISTHKLCYSRKEIDQSK